MIKTTPVSTPVSTDTGNHGAGWEAAGRKIAPMLGSYSTAVIIGSDALAAAHVAIGIGLAEAEHRRVAIGDLVGEIEPIQALVTSEDPHGISDSFTFGVSLNKIAQPVDTTGNLFIMPSGTGSVSDPEIFRNSRWQRLANGFREVGALLLLVAPADADGLKELIDQCDGVVLVGATPLDLAPYINVLARVPATMRPPVRQPEARPLAIWKIAVLLLLLVALVGAGLYFRFANDVARTAARAAFRRPAPVVTATPPSAPVDSLTVAPPANPADSAIASAYAVEVAAWNSQADANEALARFRDVLPAGTISPVPVGPTREKYYKLIVGAFPARNEADAELDVLRHKQVTPASNLGLVVRTPYALLIDSAVAGRPSELVRKYPEARRWGSYVLAQPDGALKLYAGAFERPDDAAALMMTLRDLKLTPTLVYRTGRTP
ncbi:MAG: SPOR domain-containing protein [Gemmatimonadota bacterium]|nr:SPOR domain-containing protein [Gemmatimonadota bacterium]